MHIDTILKKLRHLIYAIAKYLFGINALDGAPDVLKHESLSAAISFLEKKYKYFKPASVRFLLKLYIYLQTSSENLPVISNPGAYIIHLCCWGESYSDKVKNYLLPSLMANGNLPVIAEKYKTTLYIHCDMAAKNKIIGSPVIARIKKYAYIEFIVLPESLITAYQANLNYPHFSFFKKIKKINANTKYLFLGGLQTLALEAALKSNAYISFMMPDMVISDCFLTKAFEMIKNKKVVVASAFRSNYQKIASELDTYFVDEEKTQLAVSSQSLVDLQVCHLHQGAKSVIVSPANFNFTPSAQLLFETSKGFILRAFHYHPMLLDCYHYHFQIKNDYYPIDNTMLNEILSKDISYDTQIALCDNASDATFIEISDEHINNVSERRHEPLNYEEFIDVIYHMIVNKIDTYDTSLNHYFSMIRNKFESPHLQKTGEFIADDRFFLDLYDRLGR